MSGTAPTDIGKGEVGFGEGWGRRGKPREREKKAASFSDSFLY